MTPEDRAIALCDELDSVVAGVFESAPDYLPSTLYPWLLKAIVAAIAEERETCARAAESLHPTWGPPKFNCGENIAAAIRGRGERMART